MKIQIGCKYIYVPNPSLGLTPLTSIIGKTLTITKNCHDGMYFVAEIRSSVHEKELKPVTILTTRRIPCSK